MRTEIDLSKHITRTKSCGKKYIITSKEIPADLFNNKKSSIILPLPLYCKSYFCAECSKHKSKVLYAKAQSGIKNNSWRFLTLTTINKNGNFKNDIELMNKGWNKLATILRRRFPHFKYLKTVEVGKNGMVHIHALVNIYIPKTWLKYVWKKYTGAYIVDLSKVNGKRKILNYVLKYIRKSFNETDQAKNFYLFRKRRFSFSRNFGSKYEKVFKCSLIHDQIFSEKKLFSYLLTLFFNSSDEKHDFDLQHLPPPLVAELNSQLA